MLVRCLKLLHMRDTRYVHMKLTRTYNQTCVLIEKKGFPVVSCRRGKRSNLLTFYCLPIEDDSRGERGEKRVYWHENKSRRERELFFLMFTDNRDKYMVWRRRQFSRNENQEWRKDWEHNEFALWFQVFTKVSPLAAWSAAAERRRKSQELVLIFFLSQNENKQVLT